jgi:hypothetical protein
MEIMRKFAEMDKSVKANSKINIVDGRGCLKLNNYSALSSLESNDFKAYLL